MQSTSLETMAFCTNGVNAVLGNNRCFFFPNAKLGGIYGNHWVLGLIVRDVVLILIAECSCLAHNCVEGCYRTAGNSLTVGTYRCLQSRRMFRQAG